MKKSLMINEKLIIVDASDIVAIAKKQNSGINEWIIEFTLRTNNDAIRNVFYKNEAERDNDFKLIWQEVQELNKC